LGGAGWGGYQGALECGSVVSEFAQEGRHEAVQLALSLALLLHGRVQQLVPRLLAHEHGGGLRRRRWSSRCTGVSIARLPR
jgi:hypothetical protein